MTLSPIAQRVNAAKAIEVRILDRICNQCHGGVAFSRAYGQWLHIYTDASNERCLRPLLPAE